MLNLVFSHSPCPLLRCRLLVIGSRNISALANKFSVGLLLGSGGALIMLVVYKYFSRFARESAKAKRMLSAKELPCLKCGYPLMTAEYLICSECGEHCQRSKTIEIWRSRYLVDPFPFEEVSDK